MLLVELDEELCGAAALLLGVVLELGEVVELELDDAPGAWAAFGSVVLEGAEVGFAWLEVWSVAAGVVEVCPEVALGVVFVGVAVLWLELDGVAAWFMSELLLVDGVALEVDDGF